MPVVPGVDPGVGSRERATPPRAFCTDHGCHEPDDPPHDALALTVIETETIILDRWSADTVTTS